MTKEIQPTLLVLAAGMGSRYGALKQLDGVGPNGETIMDYSIYDALRAGFGKVVFVIRKDFEDDFRKKILSKYEGHIPVEVVYQSLDSLPEGYTLPEGRTKPWGTNHAVLMGAEAINEPFLVINADDYYGADAFEVMGRELARPRDRKGDYCMVGFRVANTMTEHGAVSRGVCTVNELSQLTDVVERHGIKFNPDHSIVANDNEGNPTLALDPQTPVSMNFWGFTPDYFEYSTAGFKRFLDANPDPLKGEYYIPTAVNDLLRSGAATVKVLDTTSRWVGVTFAEDRDFVVESLAALHNAGLYPEKLF